MATKKKPRKVARKAKPARKPVKKVARKTARKAAPKPSARYPVVAYLTVAGATDAIDFYKRAFDAIEHMRMPADDGKRLMHAALGINGGTVMLSDAFPEYGGGSPPAAGTVPPVTIMLEVDDTDAWWDRAMAAGATAVKELENMFWGNRFGQVRDPFGHIWALHGPLKK